MRRQIRRSRRSGSRRKSEWHYAFGATNGGPAQITTKSVVSHWAVWPVGTWDDSQQSFPGDLVANPTDLTLVRSFNSFDAWIVDPTETESPEHDAMWGVGMGLIKFAHPTPSSIDSQIFDSFTEIPGPFSNPTMDWVWRGVSVGRSFGNVSREPAVPGDFKGGESRAMRKLSQNEGLLHVLEFWSFSDAGFADARRDVSWWFESRMLLKEA